ncbi:type III secretion system chaperone [Marinibactrum halimedae]|uniref:Molecular chaperone Tir n=1 Tax=Marinibactrum halimedae TaxID=1444977 RepID=A0AA37WM90_9GAMM|nr:type III secretion system chaperone [Marinibactrum halimedae]MCD9459080.1 type III secretion system chaperone [Marinibactrum halimedae]GLS24681.1 hypothetical protein GCM10007877_03950 [Marinibactrum halimedae]
MNIDFPRLIQELAVNLQQPLMDPVEDACRISWDNVDMHVYYHDDNGENLVILTLDIGEIPAGAEQRVFLLMLQANYLWIASEYATLSINPESNRVAICDKYNAELVNAEQLTERVKKLYQAAVYWQEIIADEAQHTATEGVSIKAGFENDFAIKI